MACRLDTMSTEARHEPSIPSESAPSSGKTLSWRHRRACRFWPAASLLPISVVVAIWLCIAPFDVAVPAATLSCPGTADPVSVASSPPDVLDVVCRHCNLVREAVLTKWVPLARVNPATGLDTVHISFLGDSLGINQARITWFELDLCLNSLWAKPPRVTEKIHGAVPLFLLLAEATLAVPASASGWWKGRARHVELIVSNAKVRYALPFTRAVAGRYGIPISPGVEKSDVAVFTGTGYRKLPLPRVMMAIHGVGDTVEVIARFGGRAVSNDYLHGVCRNDTWVSAVERYESFLHSDYIVPLRTVFKQWQSKPTSQGEAPDFFILGLTPVMNCSALYFRPDLSTTVGAFRVFRQGGRVRCSALALAPLQVLHTQQRQAVANAIASNGDSSGTVVRVIDYTVPLNPCRIEDGTHLDKNDPICREYLLTSFWGVF